MIIGLCGLAGAGKDTAADLLVKHHGFVKLSFAAALKDVVAALFGWDRAMLEGIGAESRAWREREDVWWAAKLGKPGFSPRRALQEVGTEVLRVHWHDDVWKLALERKLAAEIERGGHIVVTDCRFPNDIAMLRERGAVIVHICRTATLPDWFEAARRGEEVPGQHPSEWLWAREKFDHRLLNDDTIETLAARVGGIVDKMKEGRE